ncbi:MAG: 30S ribosome-binding factor RbfA [bacterium]|nr:30S ribosome-binding factor RbfA [bacterium]MDE0669249.1 30S ribosome-binding factor RbfA [bacterium]
MAERRRGYERGDRLGELLREILAEELGRIDDDRLALVAVTGVEVDRDLAFADVYFSTVDLDAAAEAAAAETLRRHRRRLQSAVGRQARLRRVPNLRFHADEGMHAGARVEEILRSLRRESGGESGPPQRPEAAP